MNRLGVVTGLAAEARCLRHAKAGGAQTSGTISIVCSSGDPARAEAGARQLIAGGAGALLSFGIAGALDPKLGVGDLIIAHSVVDPRGTALATDASWREALLSLLKGLDPKVAMIAGCDRPAATVAGKRDLHEQCGAVAADMESHVTGRVAADNGVPFAVIRVIADDAHRALPRAALAGLGGADGRPRIGAVLGSLALRPWQLPALIGLALDTRRALTVLDRCAADGAPLFGRGGLG